MRCLFDVSPRRELQLLRSAHYKENSRLTGKVDVKWTIYVAVVTEDPADRSMIRIVGMFQKIYQSIDKESN